MTAHTGPNAIRLTWRWIMPDHWTLLNPQRSVCAFAQRKPDGRWYFEAYPPHQATQTGFAPTLQKARKDVRALMEKTRPEGVEYAYRVERAPA